MNPHTLKKYSPVTFFLIFALTALPAVHAQESSLLLMSGPAAEVPMAQKTEPVKTVSIPSDPSVSFLSEGLSLQSAPVQANSVISEDGYFTGIRSGATLSGTAFVQLNPDAGLDVKKVAYYLNGTQSGKEYSAPYTWGGPDGFDTSALADGAYTLSGYITTYSGDRSFSYQFNVDNSGAPEPDPEPEPDPGPEPITPGGRTAGGLDFSETGAVFSHVAHAGAYSYLADGNQVYVVDAGDPANPELVSTVQFETAVIDLKAENGAVYVLEKGNFKSSENSFEGSLWKVNTSNASAPQKVFLGDGLNPKSIFLDSTYVYLIHSHEYSTIRCRKDLTEGCSIPYNQYGFGDFNHQNAWGSFFASPGSSTLRASNPRMGHESFGIPLSAPAGHMTGDGALVFACLRNGTVEVFDSGGIPSDSLSASVSPSAVISLSENDPVRSAARGGILAVLDASGLIEIFDVSDPANARLIDSVTVNGAKDVVFDGNYLYVAAADEYRIIHRMDNPAPDPEPDPDPDPEPQPENLVSEDGLFTGVRSGAELSGTVKVQVNPEAGLSIKKVAYYLNGTQAGRAYSSPYTWGGPEGFDTTGLADGTYTLSGYITTYSGDRSFSYTFTVNNAGTPQTPEPEPEPEPDPEPDTGTALVSEDGYFTGIRSGARVKGILKVQVNPEAGLNIKKVAYYLNGTQAGREYSAPYTWKGPGGFNTASLADGFYTLSGYITTYSGEIRFSYDFEVDNV